MGEGYKNGIVVETAESGEGNIGLKTESTGGAYENWGYSQTYNLG